MSNNLRAAAGLRLCKIGGQFLRAYHHIELRMLSNQQGAHIEMKDLLFFVKIALRRIWQSLLQYPVMGWVKQDMEDKGSFLFELNCSEEDNFPQQAFQRDNPINQPDSSKYRQVGHHKSPILREVDSSPAAGA